MSSSTWRSDMATSTRLFEEVVWDEIKHWFGKSGELYNMESSDAPVSDKFDRVGGVDFWVFDSSGGMLSIASRVQTYDRETFTVRYSRSSGSDTEYQKRMRQMNGGGELPTYTVQAYVDETLGVLRNAAAVRTEELYGYLQQGRVGRDWSLIDSDENEEFFAVDWSELDLQCNLKIYDEQRAGLAGNQKKLSEGFR